MDDKEDSTKKEGAKANKLIITASLSVRDAQRIKQAFKEGRLKDLGITEINFSPELPDQGKKKWTEQAKLNRPKRNDDEAPPRP